MDKEDLIIEPSFVKRSKEMCPECRTYSIMYVNDNKYCGQCSLLKAHKRATDERIAHYNDTPDPLGEYYKSKSEEKK